MPFYISRFNDMETQEFECQIITPMLLGGADKDKAELRAPSIKGALRFWWRAINSYLSLEALKMQESAIFGEAGDKYGKSKIQIRISQNINYNGKDRANPIPHKNVKFSFPCFNPGQKFSLKIYGNEKTFDLFKLMSILGGLGKRSRRGFGSFKIDRIDREYFSPASSTNEVISLLEKITEGDFKIDKDKIVLASNVSADYAYIKCIEIGNEVESCDKLLKKIGQASHINNSDYSGYAKGRERFSSPIYVSVIESKNGYKPIITSLNTAFKSNTQSHGSNRSEDFKRDILSGGTK